MQSARGRDRGLCPRPGSGPVPLVHGGAARADRTTEVRPRRFRARAATGTACLSTFARRVSDCARIRRTLREATSPDAIRLTERGHEPSGRDRESACERNSPHAATADVRASGCTPATGRPLGGARSVHDPMERDHRSTLLAAPGSAPPQPLVASSQGTSPSFDGEVLLAVPRFAAAFSPVAQAGLVRRDKVASSRCPRARRCGSAIRTGRQR